MNFEDPTKKQKTIPVETEAVSGKNTHEEIIKKVITLSNNVHSISITGGEPLMQIDFLVVLTLRLLYLEQFLICR